MLSKNFIPVDKRPRSSQFNPLVLYGHRSKLHYQFGSGKIWDDIYLQAGHNLLIYSQYPPFIPKLPPFWGETSKNYEIRSPYIHLLPEHLRLAPRNSGILSIPTAHLSKHTRRYSSTSVSFSGQQKKQRLMSVGCQKTVAKRWVFLGR